MLVIKLILFSKFFNQSIINSKITLKLNWLLIKNNDR